MDTNALVMQLDFSAGPGVGTTLTWQCPDAILQSADSVIGPYTDVPGAVSPYNGTSRPPPILPLSGAHTGSDRRQPVPYVRVAAGICLVASARLARFRRAGGNRARHDFSGFPTDSRRRAVAAGP